MLDSNSEGTPKSDKSDNKGSSMQRKGEMAPVEVLPQLRRAEYETEPSMVKIMRMTEDELANVENFTIKNQHGKITFEGKVDLRMLDLDRLVNIQEKTVIASINSAKLKRIE